MNKRVKILFSFGLFLPFLMNADYQAPIFTQLSMEQGLSQTIVECIMQDSTGFMWFGTQDGLNKFDGINFTVIKQVPGKTNSLSYNHITALLESRKGVFWIGTFNGGLNKFLPKSNRYFHFLILFF